MGIPTVAAFHVQPENITSSIFLGKNRRVNDFLYWWFYKVFTTGSTISTVPALLSPAAGEPWLRREAVGHLQRCCGRVSSRAVPRAPELEGRFTILMIGRLSGEKRQDLIIEAAKRSKYARQAPAGICGQGP